MALYWTLLYFLASRILVQDTRRFDAYVTIGVNVLFERKKCVIFAGALWAESVKTLNDVLRIASSLGQYEFIEGVITDKELGGCLEVWP